MDIFVIIFHSGQSDSIKITFTHCLFGLLSRGFLSTRLYHYFPFSLFFSCLDSLSFFSRLEISVVHVWDHRLFWLVFYFFCLFFLRYFISCYHYQPHQFFCCIRLHLSVNFLFFSLIFLLYWSYSCQNCIINQDCIIIEANWPTNNIFPYYYCKVNLIFFTFLFFIYLLFTFVIFLISFSIIHVIVILNVNAIFVHVIFIFISHVIFFVIVTFFTFLSITIFFSISISISEFVFVFSVIFAFLAIFTFRFTFLFAFLFIFFFLIISIIIFIVLVASLFLFPFILIDLFSAIII